MITVFIEGMREVVPKLVWSDTRLNLLCSNVITCVICHFIVFVYDVHVTLKNIDMSVSINCIEVV